MSATVKVRDQAATIDGWEWAGDQDLAEMLNALLDPYGPSGSDPDPDGNEAARVAQELGGEVVSRDQVDFDKNAVY